MKKILVIGTISGVCILIGVLFLHQKKNVTADNYSAETQSIEASTRESDIKEEKKITDLTTLPLGDGKVSSSPKLGHVYSCRQNFRKVNNFHSGDWIQEDTWDSTKKLAVLGSVSWPGATFSVLKTNSKLILQGNGLPVGTQTGIFPIQRTDPAWEIDPNPNSISAQTKSYYLSINPILVDKPSCLPMGVIGYTLNGVAIYNALDDAGLDAAAHEVQDLCNGHPQKAGEYHYHGPSECMPGADKPNELIGYALDGFGIYSSYDDAGNQYTNEDLDACHGIVSEVEWNGQKVRMYHYVLTPEYPYTLGCFRGTPVNGS